MKYEVKLRIETFENWTGEKPSDWDWVTLLDVGSGMELEDVTVNELED